MVRYNFYEAFPVRYKNFKLDSTNGTDPLIEEIEIAVERIERGS